MILRAFNIIGWLAFQSQGMTVGELQRACKELSKEQIRRTLAELKKIGFVFEERKPHGRTGKMVYTLSHNVAVNCEDIAKHFFAQEVA